MKRNHGYKEQTKLQQLIRENKELKREVSRLRKDLARIDITYNEEENIEEIESKPMVSKNKWKCFECELGNLKLIIYQRRDSLFYFRKCNNCYNRTKSKKYSSEVEGITE